MENLLYYPYINVPDKNWTARVLLYYNNVGSIVPQNYLNNPEFYSPFMLDMVRNELIQPINPMDVLSHPWEITTPFLEYVNSPRFNLRYRLTTFRQEGIARTRTNGFFVGSRIHVDKFDSELFYSLEQAGLAIRENSNWFIVEKKTADNLMTYLATVIGAKINYQPTTDEIRKRHYQVHRRLELQEINKQFKREQILKDLIPFPEQIDIYKLRKFKDSHLDLLYRFKNNVELIVLNNTIMENLDLYNITIKELNDIKEELKAKMGESKLGKIILGTACGVVSAGVGIANADTISTIIGATLGFASAIYSATQIEGAENVIDQNGMKYLALIDNKIKKKSDANILAFA